MWQVVVLVAAGALLFALGYATTRVVAAARGSQEQPEQGDAIHEALRWHYMRGLTYLTMAHERHDRIPSQLYIVAFDPDHQGEREKLIQRWSHGADDTPPDGAQA